MNYNIDIVYDILSHNLEKYNNDGNLFNCIKCIKFISDYRLLTGE